MSLTLLTTTLASLAGLMFLFRAREYASIFRSRTELSIRDIHESSGTTSSFETFDDVFQALAKGLNVKAGLLRPEDTLSRLSALDSWNLGLAEELLEALVPGLQAPSSVTSVKDLIEWMDSHRAALAGNHGIAIDGRDNHRKRSTPE